jgi:hypothetical protein
MWTYGTQYLPIRRCEWDVEVGGVYSLDSGESCRILEIRERDYYTKNYCSFMSNIKWEVSILPDRFVAVIDPIYIIGMCSACGCYRGYKKLCGLMVK